MVAKIDQRKIAANCSSSGSSESYSKRKISDKEREKSERESLVLWFHPIRTIQYSLLEVFELFRIYGRKTLENKLIITLIVATVAAVSLLQHIPGEHQAIINMMRANLWFVFYWVGLGVLSSGGPGTGLHTFLLYLGPLIANVTLAAYECNSLDFPSPPYPDKIICPEETIPGYIPSLWSIMRKIGLEAFLWGVGTAIGELPPYLMAKASRLTGYDPDDAEDLNEFEELAKKREMGVELNIVEGTKFFIKNTIENVGFLGILANASFPNPLFDLVGFISGHFMMPFWTFFGAALIGKAFIKVPFQVLFVIAMFSNTLLHALVLIPWIGPHLHEPLEAFLQNQKARLHRSSNEAPTESENLIANLYELFVLAIIIFFIVTIANTLAQSHHKRIHIKYMANNNDNRKSLSRMAHAKKD